ncbi:hypothetical protein [Gordonia aurantiaca]|uniref:hypothetical protein n=1 Tax=Gordonia sp. B21 TaxID=3151852 RepID=UPI003263DA0E
MSVPARSDAAETLGHDGRSAHDGVPAVRRVRVGPRRGYVAGEDERAPLLSTGVFGRGDTGSATRV